MCFCLAANILVLHVADIFAKDEDNQTPLHWAAADVPEVLCEG
jgi:ankyrin repeat protein